MKLESFQEEVDGAVKWSFGKLDVEHATISDAEYIADNLRRADLAEIKASTGTPPKRVLTNGITTSTPCYVIRHRATRRPLWMARKSRC